MTARIGFWVALIAFIQSLIAIGGFYFVGRSLDLNSVAIDEATKAANASVRAADAAEKAYLFENRPWLKLNPTMIGPIDFVKRRLEVQVRVENVGTTPAMNVRVLVHAYSFRITQIEKNHVARLVEEHMKGAPDNNLGSALVFPGEPLETRARGEIGALDEPALDGSKRTGLWVICTATYKSSLGDAYFHTAMTVSVQQRETPLLSNQLYTGEEADEFGSRLLGWEIEPRVTSVS